MPTTTLRPPATVETPAEVYRFFRDITLARGVRPERFTRRAREMVGSDNGLLAYLSPQLLHRRAGSDVLARLTKKLAFAHQDLVRFAHDEDDADDTPSPKKSPERRPMPEDDDRDSDHPEGVESGFHRDVMRCIKSGYPHLDAIHGQYAEKYAADDEAEDSTTARRSEDGLTPDDTVSEQESEEAIKHMRATQCSFGVALQYVRAKGHAYSRHSGRFTERHLEKALKFMRTRKGSTSWADAERHAIQG